MFFVFFSSFSFYCFSKETALVCNPSMMNTRTKERFTNMNIAINIIIIIIIIVVVSASHSSFLLTLPASSSGASRSGSHSFEGPVSIPPRVLTLTPNNLTVRRGQPVHLTVTFTGSPTPVVKWFLAKTELTSGMGLCLGVCVCSSCWSSRADPMLLTRR